MLFNSLSKPLVQFNQTAVKLHLLIVSYQSHSPAGGGGGGGGSRIPAFNSHKSLLSRYTAQYINGNNKHRICSNVSIDKIITFFNNHVRLNGIFCALVDSSQPTMPMLFKYSASGSLAQHLT